MGETKSVLEPVITKVYQPDEEYRCFGVPQSPADLADFIFATDANEHDPATVFQLIRWGGQFVYADDSLPKVQSVADQFARYGFQIEKPASAVANGWKFWPIVPRKVYFFSARKMKHIPQGTLTDRFTFEVELSISHETHHGKHVVTKRLPSLDWVLNRLRHRNPDMPDEEMERRGQSLIRNILPIFLTREVALMHRLQKMLPQEYRSRVPHAIHYEQDDRGYVNLLQVNWLRNGGKPISQLDFALQGAELLDVVHTKAGIAHLDLRLDNMVITPEGVGFIDFGNSVHDQEDLANSPTLSRIFGDLMRSTQVHRVLERMIKTGHVTAPYFTEALFKPDKAIDLFYLVLQFTSPHDNPELKDLILYTPNSKEDYELHKMTRRLFAPEELSPGKVYAAHHVHTALRMIKKRLG